MTVAAGSAPTTAVGATRELAAFVAGLDAADLPETVQHKARVMLLDFFAAALGGADVSEVRTIVELVRSRGGHPVATVVGSDLRTSPADAAFATGAAADVLEHQDGYRFGGFHPSHVLPALLAVAEAQDRSVEELLTAMVAGYEVANRIGRCLHPEATRAGWFPTAAGFGAAAAAAKLLGLDADGIGWALGGAGFFVPAIAIEAIFSGHTVKPAFAGQLARAAVEAAEHAAAGLTGWDEILEHPRGLIALMGGRADDAQLTAGLGAEWTILEVHQKRWAGCRHTHGAAQACLELAEQHDLAPQDVTGIRIHTYGVAATLVDRPVSAMPTVGSTASAEVPSTVPCTLSVQYTAAAALVDRDLVALQYGEQRRADPQVHRLAGSVTLVVDPELEALYPEYTATEVEVVTASGAVHRTRIDTPFGDKRAPMTTEQRLAKFHTYADPRLGRDRAERLRTAIDGSTGRVRDLTALLRD
ncbi:MmgE/PrpD family protein [Nakamurella leprariae]|uniref:MmgE/PrpD family protein n=1 Tax=Nakamurella leprariae TaxID=2803911 RepID=A0A938YDK9_9ACTN|nr:MmgE/PrpD family protein [Nakamurella leprariae]MBM9466477.1 MmgE/PrpD family protein [Nakamurella leprariae]